MVTSKCVYLIFILNFVSLFLTYCEACQVRIRTKKTFAYNDLQHLSCESCPNPLKNSLKLPMRMYIRTLPPENETIPIINGNYLKKVYRHGENDIQCLRFEAFHKMNFNKNVYVYCEILKNDKDVLLTEYELLTFITLDTKEPPVIRISSANRTFETSSNYSVYEGFSGELIEYSCNKAGNGSLHLEYCDIDHILVGKPCVPSRKTNSNNITGNLPLRDDLNGTRLSCVYTAEEELTTTVVFQIKQQEENDTLENEMLENDMSENITNEPAEQNMVGWLVPTLAGGVSAVLILGSILVGGLCVYYQKKKSIVPSQPPEMQPTSITERVYYTINEDCEENVYCYIDPAELRKDRVPKSNL